MEIIILQTICPTGNRQIHRQNAKHLTFFAQLYECYFMEEQDHPQYELRGYVKRLRQQLKNENSKLTPKVGGKRIGLRKPNSSTHVYRLLVLQSTSTLI